MKNLVKKILAPAVLASAVALSSFSFMPSSPSTNSTEPTTKNFTFPTEKREYTPLPKFRHYKNIGGGNCSRYVMVAGEKLFGKEYTPYTSAWQRRDRDKLIEALSVNKRYFNLDGIKFHKIYKNLDSTDFIEAYHELDSLENDGVLKSGDAVGLYWRKPRRNERDDEGKPAKYTHIALYVGRDENGKLVFDQNWGKKQERISAGKLKSYRLFPMEIIGENKPVYAQNDGPNKRSIYFNQQKFYNSQQQDFQKKQLKNRL